jgi:hypothetical protein
MKGVSERDLEIQQGSVWNEMYDKYLPNNTIVLDIRSRS